MKKTTNKKRFNFENYQFLSVFTVLIIFALWQIVSNNGAVSEVFIPKPSQVWSSFITTCTDGYKNYTLFEHLLASFERLGIAFLLSIVTAIPLGLISGTSKVFRVILEPIIEFYRPLPPLAYYTLLVLWIGIGNESKITLLFLACFAPIYISCVSAVVAIPTDYVNGAKTLGANKIQIFIHVILPACLPQIFVGCRTAFGVGFSTLVASEMVAARSGIGWMVLDASNYLRSDIVFLGVIIMGITGIGVDLIFRFIEKKLVPWKGKV